VDIGTTNDWRKRLQNYSDQVKRVARALLSVCRAKLNIYNGLALSTY
jgi:hypothetical protein